MMRTFGLLCLVIIACSNPANQPETAKKRRNDLDEFQLKGKIRKAKITTEKPGKKPDVFIVCFNKEGQLDTLIEINAGGTSDTVYWIVQRDADGLRYRMYSFDQKGVSHGFYQFVNDVEGNEIQSRVYNKDTVLLQTTNSVYNQESKPVRSEIIGQEDRIQSKIEYTYNIAGKLEKILEKRQNDEFFLLSFRTYNESGYLETTKDSMQSGVFRIRYAYEYDNSGNYIRRSATTDRNEVETELREILYYE